MPAPIYGLSESDVALIKELIADRKRNVIRTRSRSIEELLPSTPEVYIALTPIEGIPALNLSNNTAYPGYAQCTIYQAIPSSTGTHTPYATKLQIVNIFPQTVYNLSGSIIQGNQYILIQRDKFGNWYSSACINCGISHPGTGTGTGTHISTSCCPGKVSPTTVCLYISNCGISQLNGAYTLVQPVSNPTPWYWSGYAPNIRGGVSVSTWTFQCFGSFWQLTYYDPFAGNFTCQIPGSQVQCSPLHVTNSCNTSFSGSPVTLNYTVNAGGCSSGTGSGTGTHTGGGCTGATFLEAGCCGGQCIPSPLHLTVTGPCTGFNGTFTLNFNGSGWASSVFSCSGITIWYQLSCVASNPNNFALNIFESGAVGDQSLATRVVCPSPGPLSIEGSFTLSPGDTCCPSGGTNSWVVSL